MDFSLFSPPWNSHRWSISSDIFLAHPEEAGKGIVPLGFSLGTFSVVVGDP